MKFHFYRLLIFLLILALSIGFGFGFDGIARAVERRTYPMPEAYQGSVSRAATEFSIPDSILWATIKCKSDFSSNALGEGDRVGLMQLSPEEFRQIYESYLHTPPPDQGMRYDPATSIYCGGALLSALYERYGVWDTVYAALFAGTEAVDAWLKDPTYTNAQGMLAEIPDREVARRVKKMQKAVDMYRTLYTAPESAK